MPFGDWMSLLSAWYGRRRSFDDGEKALELVIEAQLELGWPAPACTYAALWSLSQRLLTDFQGVPPDMITPEQRANCEHAWRTYVEGRRAQLEKAPEPPAASSAEVPGGG